MISEWIKKEEAALNLLEEKVAQQSGTYSDLERTVNEHNEHFIKEEVIYVINTNIVNIFSLKVSLFFIPEVSLLLLFTIQGKRQLLVF